MKKLLISAALVASVAMVGCESTQTTSSSYTDVLAKAEKLHSDAKAGGYVWKQKKMKAPYFDHYKAQAEAAMCLVETKDKEGKVVACTPDEAKAMKAAKLALKTAEGEVRQMNDNTKPAWEK